MNNKTQQFIKDHINDDVHQLALNANRFPDIDMDLAVRQILGKQKIRYKVPTFFENDNILYPVRLSLEQSSSELTANYKSSLCEGTSFLDLTGGFGVDSYFISRRFNKALYVEQKSELCELTKHNFKELRANNITVINSTAEDFLKKTNEIFDCIFIDPARRDITGRKLVLLSDCEPDIIKLYIQLLEKGEQVLIKLSPMLDISSILQDIPEINEIHIVAVENECKEILLLLKKEKTSDTRIHTINFTKNNQKQIFSFYITQERDNITKFAYHIKQYLYEPNAAIMKSGGFNVLSNCYSIDKLHKNTHLYVSDTHIEDFPGRIFEVKKIWDNSKKDRTELTKYIKKANIATRNFPESADVLRKKLKLYDGGDCFLFACTLINNDKKIIECTKA